MILFKKNPKQSNKKLLLPVFDCAVEVLTGFGTQGLGTACSSFIFFLVQKS